GIGCVGPERECFAGQFVLAVRVALGEGPLEQVLGPAARRGVVGLAEDLTPGVLHQARVRRVGRALRAGAVAAGGVFRLPAGAAVVVRLAPSFPGHGRTLSGDGWLLSLYGGAPRHRVPNWRSPASPRPGTM